MACSCMLTNSNGITQSKTEELCDRAPPPNTNNYINTSQIRKGYEGVKQRRCTQQLSTAKIKLGISPGKIRMSCDELCGPGMRHLMLLSRRLQKNVEVNTDFAQNVNSDPSSWDLCVRLVHSCILAAVACLFITCSGWLALDSGITIQMMLRLLRAALVVKEQGRMAAWPRAT